jgi:CheY-like chemotaxis protein
MKELLFVYHDEIFLDFIKKYLDLHNFIVNIAKNGLEGIRLAKSLKPDLMFLDKEMRAIELDGFLIKKRLIPELRDIPVFLIGDFMSNELQRYKEENVKAFVSIPINPEALLERILMYFRMPLPKISKNTPMIIDLHRKGNIIIIQIEGNFEPDKLEILNYEIRCICVNEKIYTPRILLIIPSIYPESITPENIEVLFGFFEFIEFRMSTHHVKILSQCVPLLDLIDSHEKYSNIEVVANFIDGIQKLNLDFDNRKEISIQHLKEGSQYIFDLYDDTGMIRIPALTKVTNNMIEYLLKSGEKSLTYYSETSLEEADEREVVSSKTAQQNIEIIISEYQQIDEDYDIIKKLNDKMNLFLRKLKGSKMLVISEDKNNNEIITKVLSPYINIDFKEDGNLSDDIFDQKYILIIIDMKVKDPTAIELLRKIRIKFTRKELSVIIVSNYVSVETLEMLKKNGTDNVLLSPFSTSELIKKVFQSVSSDRDG